LTGAQLGAPILKRLFIHSVNTLFTYNLLRFLNPSRITKDARDCVFPRFKAFLDWSAQINQFKSKEADTLFDGAQAQKVLP